MEAESSTTIISEVELSAGRKHAQAILSHRGFDNASLEELSSRYFALTRKNIAPADALEISSGLVRCTPSRRNVKAHTLDSFLELVVDEYVDQQIAGVHDFLRDRSSTPPRVRVGSQTYERKIQVHKPVKDLVGLDLQYRLLDLQIGKLLLWNPNALDNTVRSKENKGCILYGPPGTGKSSLMKYAVARAQEIGTRGDIPVRYESFSQDDFSKWFGESSHILKEKFQKITDPSGVGILVLEDADMYLNNRDGEEKSAGTKQVTGTFMQQLSGFDEVLYNNIQIYLTTNKIADLDSAVKRRLTKKLYVGPFKTPDQYSALTNSRLSWAGEETRSLVSELGYQQRLSPSNMSAFCAAVSESRLKRIDDSIFDLPVDERQDAVKSTYKTPSRQEIHEICSLYSD